MRPPAAPLLTRRALRRLGARLRAQRRRVGLCNGAFDLLHVGHLRYLRAAAARCDFLVVAVNSDASVRAMKGSLRPVIPQGERAELVAALHGVDAVHIFDELDVRAVIECLRPAIHFKGTDYRARDVPERDAVRACGGRVRIVGDRKGHSTTQTLARLATQPGTSS